MNDLIEELASYEHERWAKWQRYVHKSCIKNEDGSLTITKEKVQLWDKQILTKYEDLSEKEKDSDRIEAKNIMSILNTNRKRVENK